MLAKYNMMMLMMMMIVIVLIYRSIANEKIIHQMSTLMNKGFF